MCQDCIFSAQPYGYFPIICVHRKRIKELWEEVKKCRFYERAPEQPEQPEQKPWEVIINMKKTWQNQ